ESPWCRVVRRRRGHGRGEGSVQCGTVDAVGGEASYSPTVGDCGPPCLGGAEPEHVLLRRAQQCCRTAAVGVDVVAQTADDRDGATGQLPLDELGRRRDL